MKTEQPRNMPLSPEDVTRLYVEHNKSKLGGEQLIPGADLS